MSTSSRIIKNTGFLYAKMGITVLISLYTTRLILNSLGVADFGIFGVVGSAIGMLGFLNGAMAGATQRYMNYSEGEGNIEKQKAIFNNSILLHWIIAIIVSFLLEGAMYFFFSGILNIEPDRIEAAKCIYHFMVISTLFTIITVPYDAAINAHENMLYYSVVGIVESVLKLVIALYIVYTHQDKLITYGLFMTMLTVFMLIIKQLYCKLHYQECTINIKKYRNRDLLKELTRFAGWNFLGSMGVLLGNYGSGIVVNHYFGTTINAAQSVGAQLRGQMLAFSNNMLKALNPVIVKKEGEGNRNAMIKFSLTGSKLSYILFAMLAIPFIVETPYIMKIWLKNVPEWAICFSRFQMIIALAEQLTITLGTTLAAVGAIKGINIFSNIAYLFPLVIYVILFSMGFQPYWLYVIILINFGLIINGYKLYQCQKYCNLDIKYYCRTVLIPCVTCTLMSCILGFGSYLFLKEGLLRLFSSTFISLTSFLICIYFSGFNHEIKYLMRGIAKKIIQKIK